MMSSMQMRRIINILSWILLGISCLKKVILRKNGDDDADDDDDDDDNVDDKDAKADENFR